MIRDVLDVYVVDASLTATERQAKLAASGFALVWRNAVGLLAWDNNARGIRVLETIERHPRSSATDVLVRWHHVSVSLRDKLALPSWAIMGEAKVLFMGPDVECYMVHPPAARYVNFSANVLHWYGCLDLPDGVLPDFRIEGRTDPNRPNAIDVGI